MSTLSKARTDITKRAAAHAVSVPSTPQLKYNMTPNVICPKCSGPGSQVFQEIYCTKCDGPVSRSNTKTGLLVTNTGLSIGGIQISGYKPYHNELRRFQKNSNTYILFNGPPAEIVFGTHTYDWVDKDELDHNIPLNWVRNSTIEQAKITITTLYHYKKWLIILEENDRLP